jgi:hypothetical protein
MSAIGSVRRSVWGRGDQLSDAPDRGCGTSPGGASVGPDPVAGPERTPMTTQKTKSAGRGTGGARPPAGPPEGVVDPLAALLPAEQPERALEGSSPSR